MGKNEQQKLVVYGIRYLMRYPCSVAVFRRKLKAKFPEVTHEIVEEVIERMQDMQLLNDYLYAKAVAETLFRVKSASVVMVRMKLKVKALPTPLIEKVLAELGENYNEHTTCMKAATKKSKTLQRYEPEVRKQKLVSFLLRKGFSRGIVGRVTNLPRPLLGKEGETTSSSGSPVDKGGNDKW